MSRRLTLLLSLATAALLVSASPALADFGLSGLNVRFEEQDGSFASRAGSHPYAMKTELTFNTRPDEELEKALSIPGFEIPDGDPKDISALEPLGLVARPGAVKTCSTAAFFASGAPCPQASQVGIAESVIGIPPTPDTQPVYSLAPPPGVLIRLGFKAISIVPVVIDVGLSEEAPYHGEVHISNTPNVDPVYGSTVTLWGVPADKRHDGERFGTGSVKDTDNPEPFLTLPRACTGPLDTTFDITSWEGASASKTVPTEEGMSGCEALPFAPTISAVPTSKAANSPTGLDFGLDLADESIKTNAEGQASSDIRKLVVTLPEGFTTNPAIAEGLAVCTTEQLANEKLDTEPGEGCPQASKIGTVEAESPLVDEPIKGNVYIAEPYKNEFGTLLAFYFVVRNRKLGIIARQAAKVEPNPITGQLVTTTEEMPQLPLSHVRLHFREGARSPLATPPRCGKYSVDAVITPWSGGPPVPTSETFEILSGADNSACPSGGTPPFHPRLEAGTVNNAAGTYSPFNLRLSRTDSEQEFTHFSIKLPPGLTGKLAGLGTCSDADIAKAANPDRTGAEEEASPSCPQSSLVGHLNVGAGVGPALTYAPGKIYLAGPYHGAKLSLVAIAIAKVGPFDLGTVVQRLALKVNPETAEIFADATGSDPIPHIIKGILVHARDIRTYTDRPNFILNPTSCKRTSVASTVLGSGTIFGSEADDQPFTATTPFQAASCASLGFKPNLSIQLKGGTKRGKNPALKAVVTYPKGAYANIATAQVTLPHSEFLEQAHIRTVCTRVQFAAGAGNGSQCPTGAIYGKARAKTPLLDETLEGPVFLRSSSHKLPDLVVALHSPKVDVDLVGRIDSVKGGRIRNTFEAVPDQPVSEFVLEMQGGKKGLLVNSTNICKHTNKALAHLVGQNGKASDSEPQVKAKGCKGAKKGKKK
jgi:hypothetical protein